MKTNDISVEVRGVEDRKWDTDNAVWKGRMQQRIEGREVVRCTLNICILDFIVWIVT